LTCRPVSVRVIASSSRVGVETFMLPNAPTAVNHRVCGWLVVSANTWR
jgi:hypothetical protein